MHMGFSNHHEFPSVNPTPTKIMEIPKRHMLKKDWTMCSKYVKHSKFKNQGLSFFLAIVVLGSRSWLKVNFYVNCKLEFWVVANI